MPIRRHKSKIIVSRFPLVHCIIKELAYRGKRSKFRNCQPAKTLGLLIDNKLRFRYVSILLLVKHSVISELLFDVMVLSLFNLLIASKGLAWIMEVAEEFKILAYA